DLRLVSADSHLEIPSTHWAHRVPEAHRERLPKLVPTDDGGDAWLFPDGTRYPNKLNIQAGRSAAAGGLAHVTDGVAAPGTGTAEQRVAEQDRDGIAAE